MQFPKFPTSEAAAAAYDYYTPIMQHYAGLWLEPFAKSRGEQLNYDEADYYLDGQGRVEFNSDLHLQLLKDCAELEKHLECLNQKDFSPPGAG